MTRENPTFLVFPCFTKYFSSNLTLLMKVACVFQMDCFSALKKKKFPNQIIFVHSQLSYFSSQFLKNCSVIFVLFKKINFMFECLFEKVKSSSPSIF